MPQSWQIDYEEEKQGLDPFNMLLHPTANYSLQINTSKLLTFDYIFSWHLLVSHFMHIKHGECEHIYVKFTIFSYCYLFMVHISSVNFSIAAFFSCPDFPSSWKLTTEALQLFPYLKNDIHFGLSQTYNNKEITTAHNVLYSMYISSFLLRNSSKL